MMITSCSDSVSVPFDIRYQNQALESALFADDFSSLQRLLLDCIRMGNCSAIGKIVGLNKIDVNAIRFENGYSIITYALVHRLHFTTLTFLLFHIDINQPDGFGKTPVMYAIEMGDVILLEFLHCEGADLTVSICDRTPLQWAFLKNEVGAVIYLLQHGVSLHSSIDGYSPLVFAILQKNISMIQGLLHHFSFSLHERDEKGKSILDYVSESDENVKSCFFISEK